MYPMCQKVLNNAMPKMDRVYLSKRIGGMGCFIVYITTYGHAYVLTLALLGCSSFVLLFCFVITFDLMFFYL